MNKPYKSILESLLGMPGHICSGSKSCGPAMAVYNSNVVLHVKGLDPYVAWYGDVVLDETLISILHRFAQDNDLIIEVYHEHPVRQFVFKEEDAEQCRKNQLMLISKKAGLVWTSEEPLKFAGEDYAEAREKRQRCRDERVKDRMVSYGVLTPRGTDWTWYNTWYYKSIYAVYSLIKTTWKIFISFPYEMATTRDTNITLVDKIVDFFTVFKKEIYYQRHEGGLLHFRPIKLYEKPNKV